MNIRNTTEIILFLRMLAAVTLSSSSLLAQTPSPNTTVIIYQDLNNNGAKDLDEENLAGFSLDVTGFLNQKIEFDQVEDGVFVGYLEHRARIVVNGYQGEYLEGNGGEASEASVFFADPMGGEVTYYVGISTGPSLDYAQQSIILPCYEGGPAEGKEGPALISFGFMDDGIVQMLGGNAPNPSMLASVQEIGSTWGVGIRPNANIVYTSALVKRHVGLGPMGIGGLYQYDLNTNKLTSYNLSGLQTTNNGTLDFGILEREITDGSINRDGSQDNTLTHKDQVATYDINAFDMVGKAGIGDIDVSEDEETLWMVNLFKRSLVAVDVSTGEPDLNTIREFPILEKVDFIDLRMPYTRNINVGSQNEGGAEAFTDTNQVAWERDTYGKGGEYGKVSSKIFQTMDEKMGTSEDNLYKSYRAGTDFEYNIPVPVNGDYTVILHFAETDPEFSISSTSQSQNKRMFSVFAEGKEILANYDIMSTAKSLNTALTEEFTITVEDGTLNLEFLGQMVNGSRSKAMISGIQIIGSKATEKPTGELRPWGLTFYEGRGYLGLVADASISKSKNNLYGYVVSFNPEKMDEPFQLEFAFPLNYKRERASYADRVTAWPLRTAVWEVWAENWEDTRIILDDEANDTLYVSYPQPIISDLDFDNDGNLVIGIMDRWGHQVGFLNFPPVSRSNTYLIGYSAGDIIKAIPNSVVRSGYNFILEPENNDIFIFADDDGPTYNGEFFHEDYFDSDRASHGEIFTGGLGVMKGTNEVVATVFNPINTGQTEGFVFDGVYTQGTHVYSTETGDKNRSSLFVGQFQFGKASGLGDLEFGYNFSSINIGNYVWCDGNGDGIQDPEESGIPGVVLSLVLIDEDQGNQVVATTTTGSNGEYYFYNIDHNREYAIVIDLNQSGLDGFSRKASPPFQGTDPRLNSKGIDTLIPNSVVAFVSNLELQYEYGFDFGLLGPEVEDVTRIKCVEPTTSTATFNLCELKDELSPPEIENTVVRFYRTEADAIYRQNEITDCNYTTAGDTLIAKVHLSGDEMCYSLARVYLIVNDIDTDISLTGQACPGEPVNFHELVQLEQDSLMVFTSPSMEPEDMINDLTNFLPDELPATYYIKVSFEGENCESYGSITINEVPPFEIEMEDLAVICWGDLFYFSSLNIRFPSGGSAIENLYWTTNGNGTFNSGTQFAQAQSYRPSVQDSIRGYVEFYLNASNYCYEEQLTVNVEILTDNELRVECVPTDTVYCVNDSISDIHNLPFPAPQAFKGCHQLVQPVLNFVEVDMDHCEPGNNVAGRIIRHWEFNFKNNFSVFCYDTIVVLMLPEAEIICPDSMVNVECADIGEDDVDEFGNPLPHLTGVPYYDTIPLWPGIDTSLCGIYATYEDDRFSEQCGGDTKMFRRIWTITSKCDKEVVTCEQWIVIRDTQAPLIRNNYEAFVEFDKDTVYVNTEEDDCIAHFYPTIWTRDLCAGVHSVKAVSESFGAVELEHSHGYIWKAVNPIRIPMGNDPVRIEYTSSDSCWNMNTFVHYVKVKDVVPPTVVANREMKFTLQDKRGWLNAIDLDEGSYDNCGDVLVLARRVDWDRFGVNLCTDKLSQVRTLEELNKIDPLSVLDSGAVELYYKGQIEWLLEDEACGEKIVDGWIQGIRSYWAENCGPVDEHGNPLINVPQTFLGGGWSKRIPFGCEDACGPVMVEVLVMDQWCNWSKSWVTVYVEDKIPPKSLITLDDVTITCDAYAKYYKPILDLATEAGSSEVDPTVFNHLDNLLGGYSVAWENNQGQPTDMQGNVLPEKFNVINTYCEDSVKEIKYQDTLHDNQIVWKTRSVEVTYLNDHTETYNRGFIGVNCGGTVTQDIWPDLGDCGIGTIMRKFHVTTGCGDMQMTRTYVQTITIEPTCPMTEDMFSWPDDAEVCLAITYNSMGNVNLPVSLVGKVEYTFPESCRMLAMGHKDRVLDGEDGRTKKVVRTHTVMDWCTGETMEHDQMIIVTDTCQNMDGEILTLSGTILDPYDNFIFNVTMNMQTNDEMKSSVTIENGTYFLHVPENPDLVYLDKESSYRNGVSTLDLIWMQRQFRDPTVFYNPYQFIAADVNNNGLMDPADMLQIRSLILGKRNSFAQVRPWQFVDVSTQKSYSKVGAQTMYQENNWVGVKMGDVNFDSDYLIRNTNRSANSTYPIVLEETLSEDGRTRVAVRMSDMVRLSGMQIALDMGGYTGWEIEEAGLNLTDDNWAVEKGAIKLSWTSKEFEKLFDQNQVLFYLVFNTPPESFNKENITLDNSADFKSEMYTPDLDIKDIGLQYRKDSESLGLTVYPNPADQFQVFEFFSPTEVEAVVTIHAIGGKEIESFKIQLDKGQTNYHHALHNIYKSGMYVYQIRTQSQVITGRFEVIK